MSWKDILKAHCCEACAEASKDEEALKGAGAVTSTTPGIHRLAFRRKKEDEKDDMV